MFISNNNNNISPSSFFEVALNNIPVSVELFRWIDSESINILWSFNFDSLTVSMLIPVLIVSSLVHVYSIGYMSHDPHNQRFFSYLSLFTFMMIILVTSNNYLLMFVGWEGVGVCSYLLVSFWFTRIAANQSSLSAFLTNRVGDCLLTVGMFAILWSFGNIDYATVFSLAPFMSENIVTIIGMCLVIGAMAKSSQVGLHIWLPMAMEGPTPVSALIHAATMVTAGVYLLMRSSPLIEYSSTVLLFCLWLGAITTVFSSLIGLFQQDIKKVIAYSTMSQLGMMVIAIGLSSYNLALFHLVNHAFYKALLFLGAGAVIHAVADNQDFRKYGGLRAFLPLSYSVMLIASLSLVAFPFMTGFYSKDFILESAFGSFSFSSVAIYFIATIGAMFTTLYSVKVLYLTFLANPNGPIVNYKNAHEGDIFMSLPLIILAVFSIFFGYICKDLFIGLGSAVFTDNSLFIHPNNEITIDTEFAVPTSAKLLPFILTLSLTVVSLILSEALPKALIYFKASRLGYNIFGFFNQRFLIEKFYNELVVNKILVLGGQTTKVLDRGSIENFGPYGLETGLKSLSDKIEKLDKGVVTSYALYILVGLNLYMILPYITNINNSLLIVFIYATIFLGKRFSIYLKDSTPKNIKIESAFCVLPILLSALVFFSFKYECLLFLRLINEHNPFYLKEVIISFISGISSLIVFCLNRYTQGKLVLFKEGLILFSFTCIFSLLFYIFITYMLLELILLFPFIFNFLFELECTLPYKTYMWSTQDRDINKGNSLKMISNKPPVESNTESSGGTVVDAIRNIMSIHRNINSIFSQFPTLDSYVVKVRTLLINDGLKAYRDSDGNLSLSAPNNYPDSKLRKSSNLLSTIDVVYYTKLEHCKILMNTTREQANKLDPNSFDYVQLSEKLDMCEKRYNSIKKQYLKNLILEK